MRLNKTAIQRKVKRHNTGQLGPVPWPRRGKCGLWVLGCGPSKKCYYPSWSACLGHMPASNPFNPKPFKLFAFPVLYLKFLICLFLGKTNLGRGGG